MSALGRGLLSPRAAAQTVARNTSSSSSSSPNFHGRTAAYRRISTHILNNQNSALYRSAPQFASPPTASPLRSSFLPATVSTTFSRSVSFRELQQERKRQKSQESKKDDAVKDTPRPEPEAAKSEPSASAKSAAEEAEEAYQKARAQDAGQKAEGEPKAEGESQEGEAEGDAEGAKKKKERVDAPKHGNKSPWQVFTETLQTEFKASKEWNEGTKELSGAVHDFTQNPNVQKARSAYTKATDTASTAAGSALKSTAGAIGSSAAWTWDTTVVKGLRKGATVVGSGLEKATRPVRETEAYKNVKEVIDDGSSSRYGGWTEKEERRKKREAKEAREAGVNGGRPKEPLVENPEWVP